MILTNKAREKEGEIIYMRSKEVLKKKKKKRNERKGKERNHFNRL